MSDIDDRTSVRRYLQRPPNLGAARDSDLVDDPARNGLTGANPATPSNKERSYHVMAQTVISAVKLLCANSRRSVDSVERR